MFDQMQHITRRLIFRRVPRNFDAELKIQVGIFDHANIFGHFRYAHFRASVQRIQTRRRIEVQIFLLAFLVVVGTFRRNSEHIVTLELQRSDDRSEGIGPLKLVFDFILLIVTKHFDSCPKLTSDFRAN